MIRNYKIKWIKNNPYQIFEMQNFLDNNFYNEINRNFPDLTKLKKNELIKFENNKFAISSGTQLYNSLLKNNITMQKLENFINSEVFFSIFYKNFFLKYFFSRGFDLKHFVRILKIPKGVNENSKKNFMRYFSPFVKIRTTIQYSYILNGGRIVPHPDAGDKLLTLMLYFPENQNDEQENYEKNFGTTFWRSDYENLNDSHLDNNDEEKIFREKSSMLYQSKFISNNLVGFIKNKKSWHSVEEINSRKDYIRKSININFLYDN